MLKDQIFQVNNQDILKLLQQLLLVVGKLWNKKLKKFMKQQNKRFIKWLHHLNLKKKLNKLINCMNKDQEWLDKEHRKWKKLLNWNLSKENKKLRMSMIILNKKHLKVGKVLNKEHKMHMILLLKQLVKWFLKFPNRLKKKLKVLNKILSKEQHRLLKVLKLLQDIKVLNYNNKNKMWRKIFL